jgi:hypothetical protein
MRALLLAAGALLVAGCTPKDSAPAPSSSTTATPPAFHVDGVTVPAMVIYMTRGAAPHAVIAVVEDGSRAPVTLSAAGVDTSFAGVLPGRRALLAEHAADGSIAALAAARADGKERVALGSLAPGKYQSVAKALADGDAVVVELARADGSDVYALRAGAAPALLAEKATLVAAAKGRAAVMAGGDLRSVGLDGKGAAALGGGDGHDRVAEVLDGKLLVTIHEGASGDVRLVGIDGAGAVNVGLAGVEERAFKVTPGGRILFTRRAAGAGAALVSTALDGTDERALSAADLDATPIALAPDDQVLFGSAAGGLWAVGASGGAPRVIDPTAGMNVRVGAVAKGRAIYTGDTTHWPSLRAARLDGSGVVTLCEKLPWLPFFSGLMPDDRVVFYRALSGQPDEGGRVYSVKLDGSDLRPIGTTIADASGKPIVSSPSDQDFEAITPAGRVILEGEFEASGNVSQIFVGAADSDTARELSAGSVRFMALIP